MIIVNNPTFVNLEISVKPQTNAQIAATHSLASKYILTMLKRQVLKLKTIGNFGVL